MPWAVGFARQRCRAFGGQNFKVRCVQTTAPLAISGDAGQKARLFGNVADAMAGVPEFIVERQFSHVEKIHRDDAAGVRAAIARKK